MVGFSTDREGAQKLWVKTPFPVTKEVWNFFILSSFPQFQDRSSLYDRRHPSRPHDRYVNRVKLGTIEDIMPHRDDDGAEIADGQKGAYWRHAWLPDDCRRVLNFSDCGLIYVHPEQAFYLDGLENYLAASPNTSRYLMALNLLQNMAIHKLFEIYDSLGSKQIVSATDFREQLMYAFSGAGLFSNDFFRSGWVSTIPPIGELPNSLLAPYNTLNHQLGLEFLRHLDVRLQGVTTLDNRIVAEIGESMRAAYAHLVQ